MKKALFILIFATVSLGMAAQNVYTPALESPENEDTDQMPDVILNWHAVSGSLTLQYQLQLDTTMAFNSPLLVDMTQTLITGYQANKLLFNTTYYWRVRAIDGETSPWSEVWSFTTFNMVELFTPTNNKENQESNVDLTWKTKAGTVTISGLDFFNYQIDTSMNFNSPLFMEQSVAGDVFTGTTQWLRFGTTYYWRVQAGHSDDVSAWTEPYAFTVLDEVKLSSPSDNAEHQVLDVLLKWKVVGGILSYDFEIASDENFNTLVFSGGTDELEVNAEFLVFGHDYWWRVRSRHQVDTTNWSVPRKFTAINTVILKSPSNEQQNVPLTPEMIWTAQSAITGFQLQISTDVGFSNIYFDVKPSATAVDTKVTRKLAANSIYYWRMRAFTDGGMMADTTDWSEPWTFTTTNPIGIDDQRVATLSIYPNPASGKAFVKVTSKEVADAQYVLIDLLGKRVLEQTFTLNIGENIQVLNVDNLRQGIYVLRLTINGETVNQKLVIN